VEIKDLVMAEVLGEDYDNKLTGHNRAIQAAANQIEAALTKITPEKNARKQIVQALKKMK
jgi:hypothetical protein